MLNKDTGVQIQVNADTLSMIIKGNFSGFYNQILTSDVIDSLTKRLVEDFEKFLNIGNIND